MNAGELRIFIYTIIIAYFVLMNLIGFAMMGVDKQKASRHTWRVPEFNLFLVAALGGCIGTIAGMFFFRHKTKHPSFFIGLPLILIIQIAFVIWFILKSPFELLIL